MKKVNWLKVWPAHMTQSPPRTLLSVFKLSLRLLGRTGWRKSDLAKKLVKGAVGNADGKSEQKPNTGTPNHTAAEIIEGSRDSRCRVGSGSTARSLNSLGGKAPFLFTAPQRRFPLGVATHPKPPFKNPQPDLMLSQRLSACLLHSLVMVKEQDKVI